MFNEQIKKNHTSCQDCYFGIYDIGSDETKTQENCALNLLEHYKENNTEILEAYNEKSEFYIINGRKCYFKRGKDWYDKLSDGDKKDYIKKIFAETRIKYMAIIIGDDDLLNIKLTLFSILEQEIQPSFIIVIRKIGSSININELNKLLIDTGKKWRVSTPSSPEVTPQIIVNNLIDIFWQKYPIYLKINAGNVLTSGEIQRLNDMVIYDDFRFGQIKISETDTITNSFLHKFLRGNFPQEMIREGY